MSSVMDIRDGLVCYKHMQILCIRVGWDLVSGVHSEYKVTITISQLDILK